MASAVATTIASATPHAGLRDRSAAAERAIVEIHDVATFGYAIDARVPYAVARGRLGEDDRRDGRQGAAG